MADITMCVASMCPDEVRNKCYRYTAESSEHQSFSDFSIFAEDREEDGSCGYFYDNNWKEKLHSAVDGLKKLIRG